MGEATPQLFQMTGRQQLVHRSLKEKSQELANLYESALRVLGDDANPGRFLLAAHSIREMTNGLPSVLNLPILAEPVRLGDRVNALEPIWIRAQKSNCCQDGGWSGQIDEPLQKLLRVLHDFFQRCKEIRPKRRDAATGLSRQTDPAGLPLPETLEQQRVERWLETHEYFVRVAHRASTTPEEFASRLEELEQILLDNLYRRPSTDLSAIDAILAEESSDA